LTGLLKNNYSVRNSREFVDLVKNSAVGENEVLVSFDVVSLFTSVPVDTALDLILELLSSDDSLPSLDISMVLNFVSILPFFLSKILSICRP